MSGSAAEAAPAAGLIEHDLAIERPVVVGADEVGRGCLAGPIVAAAVRWNPARAQISHPLKLKQLERLADSKKLTAKRRAELLPVILEVVEGVAISQLSHHTIDTRGLEWSNQEVLRRAIAQCESGAREESVCLVDGLGRGAPPHVRAVVRGESVSAAIAMAAIVAKQHRDELMRRAGELWPQYQFASNAGYGSPAHKEAIRHEGPSPWQRRSFKVAL